MRLILALLAAACILAIANPADAADLRVLSSGAVKPLVQSQVAAFELAGGAHLVVEGDTAGALLRQAEAGAPFDVIIVTAAGIAELERAGKVRAGSAAPLAKIGIGAAVPPGAARIDIADAAGFRRALLAARAVAYVDPAAGGSSGIYLARLFERMGVARELDAKALKVPGGLVAQTLLDGRTDLALQQTTELHAVPGIVVLGPIPDEFQSYTVYVGAVSATAADPLAAAAFLRALQTPQARGPFEARGLLAP